MKKTATLFVLIFVVIVVNAQSDYYWYKGEKISLTKMSGKKYVLIEETADTLKLKKALKKPNARFIKYSNLSYSQSIKNNLNRTYKNKKWAIMVDINIANKNLSEDNQISYEAPFYLTNKNIEAGLSHLFYVKLYKLNDTIILNKLAEENNVEIIGSNKFMPSWLTLSCTKHSKGNALEMANKFYETGLFAASEPDLMTDDLPFCTNDTHFNNQWGHNNTGQYGGIGIDINFCQSRQITTGNLNITIAVLDHGFEMNHPDYANVHAQSLDTESGTSPALVLGSHGTACAGIIGANSNNNVGVSGIAPNCQIMSISNSLLGNPNSRQSRADGINFAWQNGSSVISNSWNSGVQYQIIDDAIEAALTQGRNGLGTVVVFAAGNNNGAVSYPANSNDDIIAVGALSPCGERKSPTSCDGETNWGSNFGSQLDVVAPGVKIPTTDRQGTAGYSNNDYTLTFNGTSSACPHVAAVAALILSVNPDLTQKQVADIIESTAQKVGGYNYQTTAGRPNGTWHDEMGYGVLDALAAVQAATCLSSLVNQTISSDRFVRSCSNNLYIQNVTVTGNARLTIKSDKTTIPRSFKVQPGSTLEVK